MADITTGLVAHYKFNGNGNDETGNGHDATVASQVLSTTNRYDNPNAAYLFDGVQSWDDGAILLTDHADFQGNYMTYCAWFKNDNASAPTANHDTTIIARHDNDDSTNGFMIYGTPESGDEITIGVYWKETEEIKERIETTVAGKSDWHHVAMAYERDTWCYLWVDGVLITDQDISAYTMSEDDINFSIGQTHGSYWTTWDGTIDEVRIYNRVLSDDDVTALYNLVGLNTGLGVAMDLSVEGTLTNVTTDGLVAYYPFNGDADDESGSVNVHDATVGSDVVATTNIDGESNKAYYFDGNASSYPKDSIVITAHADLNGDTFTYSTWFRNDYIAAPSPNQVVCLIGKQRVGYANVTAGGFYIGLSVGNTDTIGYHLFIRDSDGSPSQSITWSGTGRNDWHHLIIAWSNTAPKFASIWVDGVKVVDEQTITITWGQTAGLNPSIGQSTTTFYPVWKGKIDEVRIYDRVLTDAEADALYNSSNLVTNGSFEEGTSPPGDIDFAENKTTGLTGWTITGPIDWMHFSYDDIYPQAYDGEFYIDLNGTSTGSLYQDLSLVVGKTYKISFYAIANFTCGPTIKTWNVIIDNVTYNFSYDQSGKSGTFEYWEKYNLIFSYTGASPRLQFTSTEAGACGVLIDNVSVVEDIYLGHGTAIDLAVEGNTGAPNPVTNGLVAYYPFNGNANDESDNNNNGIVNGAILTSDKNENTDSAYYFNGDDYINCGDTDGFSITDTGFSVSVRFRADSLPPSSQENRMFLIGKGDVGKYEWAISINNFDADYGKLAFVYWNANGLDANSRATIVTILQDTWYHAVFTIADTSSLPDAYLDGSLDNGNTRDTDYPPLTNNNADLYIGARTDLSEFEWDGKIDDVRIYDRVLSTDEIIDIYNYNSTGINTGFGTAIDLGVEI